MPVLHWLKPRIETVVLDGPGTNHATLHGQRLCVPVNHPTHLRRAESLISVVNRIKPYFPINAEFVWFVSVFGGTVRKGRQQLVVGGRL